MNLSIENLLFFILFHKNSTVIVGIVTTMAMTGRTVLMVMIDVWGGLPPVSLSATLIPAEDTNKKCDQGTARIGCCHLTWRYI